MCCTVCRVVLTVKAQREGRHWCTYDPDCLVAAIQEIVMAAQPSGDKQVPPSDGCPVQPSSGDRFTLEQLSLLQGAPPVRRQNSMNLEDQT